MSPRIESWLPPAIAKLPSASLTDAHKLIFSEGEKPNSNLMALPATVRLLDNSLLRGLYNLGSWANQNLSSYPLVTTQNTIGAAGGYVNTQVSFNQQIAAKAIKRTPLPWVGHDFINNHFLSDFKPTTKIRAIGILGQVFDAITGVINLSEAFKKDIDSDNNSLSNTLNASIRSVGQISLAGATGVAVAGLAATTVVRSGAP